MLRAILVYNSGYVCHQVDTTRWKCLSLNVIFSSHQNFHCKLWPIFCTSCWVGYSGKVYHGHYFGHYFCVSLNENCICDTGFLFYWTKILEQTSLRDLKLQSTRWNLYIGGFKMRGYFWHHLTYHKHKVLHGIFIRRQHSVIGDIICILGPLHIGFIVPNFLHCNSNFTWSENWTVWNIPSTVHCKQLVLLRTTNFCI
jgi:hypothetical protein